MATADSPEHVHLADVAPRPAFLRSWERFRYQRAHWLVECMAEAGGTFCYCWFGMGATAAFNIGNILEEGMGIGSLLGVGFGYGMGIILALCIFSATSGGHFNPCVTISFCVFRGFPWAKAPRYIVAQIFGAYLAGLCVYAQWRNLILPAEAALTAKGVFESVNFTSSGLAGIFGLYVAPGSNLGFVFFNEFVCDSMIGLAIWAAQDPTNPFIPPPAAPWVVAFTYSAAIWGFAAPGLAANTARDLGGRFAAMTLYGRAASGGNYAAITALTSIFAMLCAATFYELVLADSSRVIPSAQRNFLRSHQMHLEHRHRVSGVEGRYAHNITNNARSTGVDNTSHSSNDKGGMDAMIEHA